MKELTKWWLAATAALSITTLLGIYGEFNFTIETAKWTGWLSAFSTTMLCVYMAIKLPLEQK